AMDEAAITGKSTVTRVIDLVQDKAKPKPGFNMYYPLYDETQPIDTEEQRLAALRGYIYAPFHSREIFNGIFDPDETVFDFAVYDGLQLTEEHKLFNSNQNKPYEELELAGYESIEVLNREWTIQYFASDDIVPEVTRNRPRG